MLRPGRLVCIQIHCREDPGICHLRPHNTCKSISCTILLLLGSGQDILSLSDTRFHTPTWIAFKAFGPLPKETSPVCHMTACERWSAREIILQRIWDTALVCSSQLTNCWKMMVRRRRGKTAACLLSGKHIDYFIAWFIDYCPSALAAIEVCPISALCHIVRCCRVHPGTLWLGSRLGPYCECKSWGSHAKQGHVPQEEKLMLNSPSGWEGLQLAGVTNDEFYRVLGLGCGIYGLLPVPRRGFLQLWILKCLTLEIDCRMKRLSVLLAPQGTIQILMCSVRGRYILREDDSDKCQPFTECILEWQYVQVSGSFFVSFYDRNIWSMSDINASPFQLYRQRTAWRKWHRCSRIVSADTLWDDWQSNRMGEMYRYTD